MITSYNFDYCTAEIYEDYIVVIINEGITVVPEHISELNFVAQKHFENKFFVYITHRINSYAIDPMTYFESNKIPNLLGFAIVSSNNRQKKQSKIEKVFTNKALQHFDTMEDALTWKNKVLKKHTV
ncbi:hypothetical protein [Aquimarina sp. MMG016]|uniref:hypothetical protein n=1 Tax=Aquimarina sp. MMG016 TaxID=2822690 RepID=UPI001B39E3CC|nr:hypothetical protein [Aquimarina sp. MMG016]MBQ4821257.1 hypothetical protein [Aquimarina sp. MMG016]